MRPWLGLALLLVGCSRGGLSALFNEVRGEPYPLDALSREAGPDAGCPTVELTTYTGSFSPALRVTPAFAERLTRFERISGELARSMFGRAPARIRHAGAYLCRPIRQRSERWSEHALGNAVDVTGFDFPRLPRGDAGVGPLPPRLQRPFEIRVGKHWHAGEDEPLRGAFLHQLSDRLDDVFRGMIGPADPNHRTHLHFDMGPWRYRRL
jgi:hypothetical protein